MLAMYTTMAVYHGGMLCRAYPVGPVRRRKWRNMEDWVYSKLPVTLEILLNIIFVAVSVPVLVFTVGEPLDSDFPVRVWLAGCTVHCLVNVVLVWFEYRRLARRRSRREARLAGNGNGNGNVGGDGVFVVVFYRGSRRSYACRCDVFNMWASLVWEFVGVCWIPSPSPDNLLWQNAPWLYRLTMICLIYDGIFAMLSLVGFVVCFSFRIIAIIMYTAAGQKQEDDASEANLSMLPKYRFHMSSNGENPSVGAGVTVPMDTGTGDSATGCVLVPEHAECCICLCSYDDGVELHVLPCKHHFHATCIEAWLKINAKCPVCNYNILKGSA